MSNILEVKEKYVNFALIHNPLEPVTSRVFGKVVWSNEKTLYDYMYDLPEGYDWQVFYNLELHSLEDCKNIYPEADCQIVISPNLQGSGGGKTALRMVAMIAIVALAVVTAGAAFAAAGAWGAGIGGTFAAGSAGTVVTGFAAVAAYTAGALAYGAVMYAGMALTDALIPVDEIETGTESIATNYGIDSQKPTHTEGSVVPIVYGKYRTGGVIIQNKTKQDGDIQTLYMLQALSEGEVESLEDIFINEQPIEQYDNVEYEFKNGVDNQEIIPWFEDSVNALNVSVDMSEEWLQRRTDSIIDKFSLDFVFPLGLINTWQNSKGKTRNQSKTVQLEIQYKRIGETQWSYIEHNQRAKISKIFDINDGDYFQFLDEESKTKFVYNFSNIVYQDYNVEEKDGYIEINKFIKVESSTGETIDKFIEALKQDFSYDGEAIQHMDLKVVKSFYNGIEYVLELTPLSYNYNFEDIVVSSSNYSTFEINQFSGDIKTLESITAMQREVLRKTIESPQLYPDYYDVRVRRTTPEGDMLEHIDQCNLTNLNQILLDDVTYNHTSLLATKIRVDGQFTSIPEVNGVVKGVKINKYNYNGEVVATEWSANPAWITIDLLTNERYGAGININRLDIPKFIQWAEYCDEQNMEFNGVFNSDSNVYDATNIVTVGNHASLIFAGTKISLTIDKAEDSVFLFNNSNIVEGSFSTDWSGIKDRPNVFQISYSDEALDYEQNTIKITEPTLNATGEMTKELSVQAVGITSEERAKKELTRYMNRMKYLQQTVKFSAPIEAIGCTIGDVITVQHDMPQWGFGGKLESGCTKNSLVLDRPIDMSQDRQYSVLVQHSAVKIYELKAMLNVGKSIFVLEKITEKVQRAIIGGKDYEIQRIVDGSPYTEIILSEDIVTTPEQIVELWATDFMEKIDIITNATLNVSKIELKSEMKYQPQQYSNWLLGYKDSFEKKFRISSMSGLNTETIDIQASEYADEFYEEGFDGNYTNPSHLDYKPKPVTNLSISEKLVKTGTSFSTNANIMWDTNGSTSYYGADIYYRTTDNQPFVKIGQSQGGLNWYTIENLEDGQYIEIKVVSFDGLGRRSSFNEAPIITYEIIGKDFPPATPLEFEAKKTSQGVELSWLPVPDADIYGYIIKEGNDWLSGQLIDEKITSNRYLVQYSEAGEKEYMLKSLDLFGNESNNFATTSIILTAPLNPIDFMAVQNNDFIVLKWGNLDETVSKFRIKEGESWGSGTIVADVSGYSFSVPINGYFNRKFWLKSIDNFGVFCEDALLAAPNALEHQSKNIIVEYPESGNKFPNPNINMELVNDYLITKENAKYGEYIWDVNLGEELFSRVLSSDEIDAVAESKTWQELPFAWNSFEGNSPWVVQGNIDSVAIERQMALPTTSTEGQIDSFSFNNTTVSTNGNEGSYYGNVKYENGRFADGIFIDDSINLSYNVDIKEEFSLKLWIKPKNLISAKYLTLENESQGNSLSLTYLSSESKYILSGSDGNELSISSTFNVEEPILICVSQFKDKRALMIGFSRDLTVKAASEPYGPTGDFTKMTL